MYALFAPSLGWSVSISVGNEMKFLPLKSRQKLASPPSYTLFSLQASAKKYLVDKKKEKEKTQIFQIVACWNMWVLLIMY